MIGIRLNRLALKLILVFAILAIIVSFYFFEIYNYINFEYLKSQRDALAEIYNTNKLTFIALYGLGYITLATASLPGAAVLTLAGGAIFGFWSGLFVVSIASTVGATFAFIVSRFLLREYFESKFGDRLEMVDRGLEKEGWFYLLTLRLVPAFPFFLVNILMGLTKMRVAPYFFISLIGMLPGTAVFVAAGMKISKIDSISGILDPVTIGLFILLSFFSRISKAIIDWWKRKRTSN